MQNSIHTGIYDFGFTIDENFGFTRLRVTAETPRQAIDEGQGETIVKSEFVEQQVLFGAGDFPVTA